MVHCIRLEWIHFRWNIAPERSECRQYKQVIQYWISCWSLHTTTCTILLLYYIQGIWNSAGRKLTGVGYGIDPHYFYDIAFVFGWQSLKDDVANSAGRADPSGKKSRSMSRWITFVWPVWSRMRSACEVKSLTSIDFHRSYSRGPFQAAQPTIVAEWSRVDPTSVWLRLMDSLWRWSGEVVWNGKREREREIVAE